MLAAMNVNGTALAVRQPGSSPAMSKTKVCRCLFGEVEHTELKRVLDESKAILSKQQSDKWNFNFTTETPMSGRYDWRPVLVGDENVPIAYALSGMTTTEASCPTATDVKCVAKRESECSQDKQTSSVRCKTKRKSLTQRHIPDYLPKKKRQTNAKRTLNMV